MEVSYNARGERYALLLKVYYVQNLSTFNKQTGGEWQKKKINKK